MEIYTPMGLYCAVGKIQTTINVDGGELADNAEGYVESICSGCGYWTDEDVKRIDEDIKQKWGTVYVHHGRVNTLEQLLVDQSRFRNGVKSKIVVARCTPLDCR